MPAPPVRGGIGGTHLCVPIPNLALLPGSSSSFPRLSLPRADRTSPAVPQGMPHPAPTRRPKSRTNWRFSSGAATRTPNFWTDFQTANPDTDVTFEFGDTDANILAQMQGGSQADIFHFYTGWQQFYVDEGLVREIDTSKLTNWDKVPEDFKALGQIDGKQYFLPWDWGFTSILYNTEHVDEVTSWDVLFDPQYAEHVSMWNDGPGGGVRVGLRPRLRRDRHHR